MVSWEKNIDIPLEENLQQLAFLFNAKLSFA